MNKAILLAVMIIGIMTCAQGQVGVREIDSENNSYTTYEWFGYEDDPDLYSMVGADFRMMEIVKSYIGDTKPHESGFVMEDVHYKLWKHVQVDGRDAMIMLVDADYESTLSIGFYNGGGAPGKP